MGGSSWEEVGTGSASCGGVSNTSCTSDSSAGSWLLRQMAHPASPGTTIVAGLAVGDPGANNWALALAVQTHGKIVVGGLFTTLGGAGGG